VHDGRRRWRFERVAAYEPARSGDAAGGSRVSAPMPGRIVVTRVQAGDRVSEGQELLVMEAMEMELALKAPRDGVVAGLVAREGGFGVADGVMLTVEHQRGDRRAGPARGSGAARRATERTGPRRHRRQDRPGRPALHHRPALDR